MNDTFADVLLAVSSLTRANNVRHISVSNSTDDVMRAYVYVTTLEDLQAWATATGTKIEVTDCTHHTETSVAPFIAHSVHSKQLLSSGCSYVLSVSFHLATVAA